MAEFFDQFQKSVQNILRFEILGNSGMGYLEALVIFILFYLLIKFIKNFLLLRFSRWAATTKTKLDDNIAEVLGGISNFFLGWVSVYVVSKFFLDFGTTITGVINGVLIISAVFEVIKIMTKVVTYTFQTKLKGDTTTLHAIMIVIKIVLWTVGLLLVLSNLGFDVTTLAASLGVGGIAVALAAQTILQDLFASFSIFFDKPFKIGDFIVIGTDKGTVKKIGLKTTRIETLQGEELIVSNTELTTARVQNFKKMTKRRVDFTLGLVYGTPAKKLQEAKKIIQEVIEKDERAEFLRAHFTTFGDFSLNLAIAYKVHNNDINEYLDTQEQINLAILQEFEKAKLEMAFPTQTLHVVKG